MQQSPTPIEHQTLTGIQIAPGLARGQAFIYQDILQRDIELYDIEDDQVPEEHQRLTRAIDLVRDDLEMSASRVEEDFDRELADIFRAQQAMLDDVSLTKELLQELQQGLVNAEHITRRVLRRWERKFREQENARLSQRADDIADLSRRVLRALQGIHAHTLETMPDGSVLVARRLLPSDTIFLSRQSTVAVVVEFGGQGSHAALLTRSLGIPAVGQIADILTVIQAGDMLYVNGNEGIVTVNPESDARAAFEEQIADYRHVQRNARQHCREAARTRDGVRIDVSANVSCREDAEQAADYGADGIGLYRIESLYLARKILPSAEELRDTLTHTLEPLRGKPATIRLLDAGGDKELPSLNLPAEKNPFLGRRGIRLLRVYPEVLRTQLKAILHVGRDADVRILVPMVTLPDDMRVVRQQLDELGHELELEQLPPLGAMIETPAAALGADAVRQYADFFSIGTNDLTQYTMAASRENPHVSAYFQDDHPVVLKLVRLTLDQAGTTPVSVCGELAGNLPGLPKLLRAGIRRVSVPAPLIPMVKERIRQISLESDATASGGQDA